MKKLLVAAAFGATTLAGAALAQTAPVRAPQPAPTIRPMPPGGMPHGGRGLLRADANHDGIVTRDEVTADADRRFDRLDANRDGKLDAGEMQAMRDAMLARRAAAGQSEPVPPPGGPRHAPGMGPKADPDGDGMVTRDEYRARALRRFDRLDANRDGRLDAGEMPQRPVPTPVYGQDQPQTPPSPADGE